MAITQDLISYLLLSSKVQIGPLRECLKCILHAI